MEVQAKILQLFKSLTYKEKKEVLKDLEKESTNQLNRSKDSAVSCCPHCSSELFVKNGHRGATQNYKCKSCFKVFNSKTGTALHGLHKPEKFELYKSLMLEAYYSLKQIAKKVGITVQTAFDWRHKILTAAKENDKNFEGIVEMDDVWFLYSQKGRKGLKYSRKRGGTSRSGDNNFQAKLLVITDRNKTTDMPLACIGRLSKADIERKVSGRFSDDCTLVSDKHGSIAAFAKSEELKHVSFKSSEHTAGGDYHVQNINNMTANLKSIVNHSLKGVSTKYLQNYATWYQLMKEKIKPEELSDRLMKNKNSVQLFVNREGIYRWFIENLSKRTYRCPVKIAYASSVDQKTIGQLGYI